MITEPPTAAPAVRSLRIGRLEVSPPVVLAPMAGVTNPSFRRMCRRYGGGLFVSEMVTARGLVEGGRGSWERAAFDGDESPRSIQLYGSDPVTMGEAVRRLVDGGRVDHVDLNLGCPVRKITRHGGGAALTARPRLLERLLVAAVTAAGPVPVTVKFRMGIDDRTETFLETGRIAADSGCAAVALHARSAAQLYSGTADWTAIARLRAAVSDIPVLGNGDIWTGADAVRMLAETGCDGVVVGRGCLGRPWLFRDLADALAGRRAAPPPVAGEVVDALVDHLRLLVRFMGAERARLDIRKHVTWYLTGYPVGGEVRRRLQSAATVDAFEAAAAEVDRTLSVVPGAAESPRGTRRGPQSVALPAGWLDDRTSADAPGAAAEVATSGG